MSGAGHPAGTTDPVLALAHAVAGYGLTSAAPAWPAAPVDDATWTGLISCVKDQRLGGLAMQAVADGALPTTAEQRDEVGGTHLWWMRAAVELERTLLRTVDRLDAGGIDYRVLKGSAVAHLDYDDPALRCFGDVDLLVRSTQFDAAIDLLVASGHERRFPQPRRGFDHRFGKGTSLRTAGGHELDVHRTFAMGPFGLRIELDDLWARQASFRLGPRELAALAAEERFLHACFHAALGEPVPRLTPLRDVAQLLLVTPLDLALVRRLMARWRAEAVVARAVGAATLTFGLDRTHPLIAWALAYEPGRGDRQAMAVYLDPHQNYAAKAFASLTAIRGVRNRLAYSAALAFPSRRYLQPRHAGRLRRWSRGLAQVRRSRRQ